MSLVDRIRARLRDTRGRVLLGRERTAAQRSAYGYRFIQPDRRGRVEVVGGPLDGQPPVARSNGWGERPGGR